MIPNIFMVDPKNKTLLIIYANLSLGLTLAVGFILFGFIGYYFDQKYTLNGWGVLSGIFMGMVYASYEVWKALKKIDQDSPGVKK